MIKLADSAFIEKWQVHANQEKIKKQKKIFKKTERWVRKQLKKAYKKKQDSFYITIPQENKVDILHAINYLKSLNFIPLPCDCCYTSSGINPSFPVMIPSEKNKQRQRNNFYGQIFSKISNSWI